ncbi:MAG: hypothetical protein U0992_24870 [Planctomycetaceae bacterium]
MTVRRADGIRRLRVFIVNVTSAASTGWKAASRTRAARRTVVADSAAWSTETSTRGGTSTTSQRSI